MDAIVRGGGVNGVPRICEEWLVKVTKLPNFHPFRNLKKLQPFEGYCSVPVDVARPKRFASILVK